MPPIARRLAFTASVAVDVAPETDSVAVPSVVLPVEKVTLPVGAALPLAGFTVASSWVAAVDGSIEGFAVTDVVVLKADPVTAIATDADELAKFPFDE